MDFILEQVQFLNNPPRLAINLSQVSKSGQVVTMQSVLGLEEIPELTQILHKAVKQIGPELILNVEAQDQAVMAEAKIDRVTVRIPEDLAVQVDSAKMDLQAQREQEAKNQVALASSQDAALATEPVIEEAAPQENKDENPSPQ